ncbi:hypothetical protein MKX03_000576 [Papaver bracteatum]|nr:hypothetical protein MKX03_000576 [Papaver bracteatum]
MCLTELIDPEKGFIIDDICYIKVEIFSFLDILKSIPLKPEIEPEADWGNWGNCFQTLIGAVVPSGGEVTENEGTTDSREMEDIPVSVEATTQAAGDSKSASNKKTGENQKTETKDEKRTKEKEDIPGSVETTTQAAGGSKSASNKKTGENQNTETKDEEKSLSLYRWFQERKEDIGNYFNDDSGYQRLH